MQMLRHQPHIGRPVEDFREEYREWPVGFGDSGYVARNRIDPDAIIILAVRHQKEADDCPVAVLNHSRPEAYLLSAAHYERLMAYLEDLEDAKLVRERADGSFVEVSLDDL